MQRADRGVCGNPESCSAGSRTRPAGSELQDGAPEWTEPPGRLCQSAHPHTGQWCRCNEVFHHEFHR